MFSQFGTVLDIVAMKTLRMRGQAFVVFRDITAATNAMRAMQNFPFYDKPMKIHFAKTKSDIISKLDGSYVARDKSKKKIEKRKAEEIGEAAKKPKKEPKLEEKKKKKKDEEGTNAQSLQPKQQPPNKILFIENLPPETTDMMLQMLFQQFPGFKEVRLVKGKSVVAFVEFENEVESGVAMASLQHFKITATHLMVISYAKRG